LTQAGEGRQFYFQGTLQKRAAVDLVIAEYPDGLPDPGLSNPPSKVPTWNAFHPKFLQVMMSFMVQYLHDDAAFLLFYLDSVAVKKEISGYFKNYHFKVQEEWIVINSLYLANPLNQAKNVRNSIHSFRFILHHLLFLNSLSNQSYVL
jgi:hypothetical protein